MYAFQVILGVLEYRGRARANDQATLQTSAGPVVLPPVAVHALGLVNGEARYAEILEAVADIPDSKSIPETTRRELDACIQHLLDIRVLSARRR